MQQQNKQLLGYGIAAVIAVMILQHTWQWIVGALAMFGVYFILDQISRNRRR